jgi:hypothetical protein
VQEDFLGILGVPAEMQINGIQNKLRGNLIGNGLFRDKHELKRVPIHARVECRAFGADALDFVPESKRDGMSVVADKLHLERRAVAMHQHRRAHVAAHQPVCRQIAGQSHGVQFIDCVHNFGNVCAVTKHGALPATSIYHALRTFKPVPSGAINRPSTT